MATFGKKSTGAARAAVFGKRPGGSGSAGVFGTPAHAARDLSPEARAFLEAERGLRSATPSAASFPLPSDPPVAASAAYTPAGKPAGKPVFGRRIIARIVDELLILIPVGVILLPSLSSALSLLAAAEPGSPEEARANLELLKAGGIIFLAQALYGILMESSVMQATLGKLLVGAVVTNGEGQRPGLGAVIMRNTLGRLIVNVIPLYIGYLIALFRPDRKGVHDMIAGTMVRARATAGQAAYPKVFA